MITALVLIQTRSSGSAVSVAAEAIKIAGITSAETVSGPYDVIARAEVQNLAELSSQILTALCKIEGIVRTVTLPVIRTSEHQDASASNG